MRRILIVLTCLFLGACQTTTGSGPVQMSAETYHFYQKYLKEGEPLVFALSDDGFSSYYYYCREIGCRYERNIMSAIDGCERFARGKKCYIFDVKGEIVWNKAGSWNPLESDDEDGRSASDDGARIEIKLGERKNEGVRLPHTWIAKYDYKLTSRQNTAFAEYAGKLKEYPVGAFAVADNGAFGWQTSKSLSLEDVSTIAHNRCKKYSEGTSCYIYSIRDEILHSISKAE